MIEHTGDGPVHVFTMQNERNLIRLPFLAHLLEAESEGDSAPVLVLRASHEPRDRPQRRVHGIAPRRASAKVGRLPANYGPGTTNA